MASENNQMTQTVDQPESQPKRAIPEGRRYVGTKETLAYIIYDISVSFNIQKYNDIFVTDIIKIGLGFQKIFALINGVWDVINDIFVAAFIDKTRTRFGKFKPYLVAYAIPGVIMGLFYWGMPTFLGDLGMYDTSKLVIYAGFQILKCLADTINNVAKTGMLSTITPNIFERTRLITQANLFSGFVEKGPEIIMGVLIDLVSRGTIKIRMRSLFVSAGMICTVISGAMAMYFSIVSKERVLQVVEKPSIIDSFKSILTNKPLLLMTLAEFLAAFGVNSGTSFYFVNVLGFASMTTIVGIPGAVISPLSYTYVPKLREKFSMKTLWIVGGHLDDILMSLVFLVGSINKNYKKISAMIPAFMIRETVWMTVWGVKKVIPEEMRNEAIDYGEWKNGYRTEGMTGVAKGLATKLVNTVGSSIKNLILEKIGYKQGAGFGRQTESTEYALFAMCTIIPVVTGILAIIPKLFYDITGEKRDRMYRELHERRKAIADEVNESSNLKEPEEDKN